MICMALGAYAVVSVGMAMTKRVRRACRNRLALGLITPVLMPAVGLYLTAHALDRMGCTRTADRVADTVVALGKPYRWANRR